MKLRERKPGELKRVTISKGIETVIFRNRKTGKTETYKRKTGKDKEYGRV